MSHLRSAGELILYPEFLIVVYFVSYYFEYFSIVHAIAMFVVKVMGQGQNVIISYVKDSHYATALRDVV